jgi:hypothetical protein
MQLHATHERTVEEILAACRKNQIFQEEARLFPAKEEPRTNVPRHTEDAQYPVVGGGLFGEKVNGGREA